MDQIIRCADQKQPDLSGFTKHALTLSLVIQRYEGETSEGQPNGEGVACFVGGHMYKGMFSRGLMDGRGVFTWAGGVKYEGNFVSNLMMGLGRYCWLDGSTYAGEVRYGIRHGTGSYHCARTGVLYRGQWLEGKRQGKGSIYYNKDKTNWYKGDWVMNKIEGFGVRRYLSGNIYEGEWIQNLRHGEGKMQWFLRGQQYEGTWHNGEQHGHGKHTWILKRGDGSRYSQSNQYIGDFVNGQRHGQGTFYYADGAMYEGEWRNNKKHGKGKFTCKNGKVFQGEFVYDQMLQLRNDRPLPLLASDSSSVLGPDMTLNIDALLKSISEKRRDAELKEVELVVLRHSSELRSIYSFYSRLGHARSPDNTFMLSRMQLWRLLKDCQVHHHDITLSQIDLLIRDALESATSTEVHSPFTGMLFCKLLSCLVVIAHHIYHKEMVSQRDLLAACFSKLMTNNILPNAKNVKGFLFREPEHTKVAMRYCRRSWEVYQTYSTLKASSRDDKTMTCQDLLFMFKDFHLFDDILTASKFMNVITEESPDPSNTSFLLNQEITFLEFFDALLGCAEVKCQCDQINQVIFNSKNQESQITSNPKLTSESKNSEMVDAPRDENGPSDAHIESMKDSLQLTESKEEDGERVKSKLKEEYQKVWEQRVHHFFDKVFFNAFEQHQFVKKTIKEKNLSLKAEAHMVLTKPKQQQMHPASPPEGSNRMLLGT